MYVEKLKHFIKKYPGAYIVSARYILTENIFIYLFEC